MNCPILLLGRYEDLCVKVEIGIDDIIDYAQKKKCVGLSNSSKTGKNVEEAFYFMVYCLYQININHKNLTDI